MQQGVSDHAQLRDLQIALNPNVHPRQTFKQSHPGGVGVEQLACFDGLRLVHLFVHLPLEIRLQGHQVDLAVFQLHQRSRINAFLWIVIKQALHVTHQPGQIITAQVDQVFLHFIQLALDGGKFLIDIVQVFLPDRRRDGIP
ncbi:hypothetical protein D3C81_1582270 [compost metagenome]